MRASVKRRLQVALGVLLSGGLLVLAFRGIPLSEMWPVLSRLRPLYLPALAGLVLTDLALRALRWRLLLRPAARVRPQVLFRLEAIGLALNNVLFLRLGELGRAYLGSRETGVPLATVFATVVVERCIDLGTILCLFGAASWFQPELAPPQLAKAAWIAGAALGMVVFGLPFLEGPARTSRAWGALARSRPAAGRFLDQIFAGARALHSVPAAAGVLALSAGVWLANGAMAFAASRSIGLVLPRLEGASPLSFAESLVVLAAAGASSALPAVPGAFGPFEQAVKTVVSGWGAPQATALAYAGVLHLSGYIVNTTLGAFFLYRAGHTLAGLRRDILSSSSRP